MLTLATDQRTAAPIGSIIIPAHNEEASIGRCLSTLLEGATPGAYEIIVVCNGCSDGTANEARAFGSMVRVIEIEVGSKVIAVNLGNQAARFHPRLYLDADLELTASSARALLLAAASGDCLAAIGQMETDRADVPWLMRQYYAVWSRHGYLKNGKFGGAYALSEQGCAVVGVLPPVINDDEYVRRRIPLQNVRVVPGCSFKARLPRTFRDLLAVRTRVHRGNRQLKELARASGSAAVPVNPASHLMLSVSTRPRLWLGAVTYVAVNAIAKLRARKPAVRWGRDESSRRSTPARAS